MGCIEPSLGIGMVVALPFCVRQAGTCDSKAHSLDSWNSRFIISASGRRWLATARLIRVDSCNSRFIISASGRRWLATARPHSSDSPDSRSIITNTDSQRERRYDLTFNILSTVNQNRKSGMSGFQAIFQSSTVFVSDEKEMPIFATRLPSAW